MKSILTFFEVQRSENGKDFVKVGTLDAKGAGSYSLKDHHVPYNTSVFYRLKMVDIDGQYDYSKVETVTLVSAVYGCTNCTKPCSGYLPFAVQCFR
jgi:hypothetical protein